MKPKIVIFGGPTAVGKSSFAVEVALRFGGEIISADSMQIYRGLDIGTGKITPEESRGVKHYLIDILEPSQEYSVSRFVDGAKSCIKSILDNGKLPIIVGGTALYINALLGGFNVGEGVHDEKVREKWKLLASQNGNRYIYDELAKVDPESAAKIDEHDTKRLIRALEIYETTGKPKSAVATRSECEYDYLFFVLNREREQLYSAINSRVDAMFERGFWAEATKLIDYRDCQCAQAIGYKQILRDFAEFGNEMPHERWTCLVDEIKRLSRNYAKRQLTFFRGMDAKKIWIAPDDYDSAFSQITSFL